jgi:HSP20 family protein
MLTVSAERRFEPEDGDQVLIRERPQGQFTRQLLLGENLDEEIEANYENGVLTLAIPVAEKAKPRRISVGGSGAQQTIEGESRRT